MDISPRASWIFAKEVSGINVSNSSTQSALKVTESNNPDQRTNWFIEKEKEIFDIGRKANQRRILKDFVLLLVWFVVAVKNETIFFPAAHDLMSLEIIGRSSNQKLFSSFCYWDGKAEGKTMYELKSFFSSKQIDICWENKINCLIFRLVCNMKPRVPLDWQEYFRLKQFLPTLVWISQILGFTCLLGIVFMTVKSPFRTPANQAVFRYRKYFVASSAP